MCEVEFFWEVFLRMCVLCFMWSIEPLPFSYTQIADLESVRSNCKCTVSTIQQIKPIYRVLRLASTDQRGRLRYHGRYCHSPEDAVRQPLVPVFGRVFELSYPF